MANSGTKIKVIGGLHGLFGDLVMQTSALKSLKRLIPNSEFTMAVSKNHQSIFPLFQNNYLIDKLHVWEGDDSGLTENDRELQKQYDIVLPSFPKHSFYNWYNKFHYLEETSIMLGLSPNYDDLSCYLNPYFGKNEKFSNYVCISAFPSKSTNLNKTLSLEKWEQLCQYFLSKGVGVIQLGGKFDIQIPSAEKPDFTFLEAAQCLYSSRLQITTDTSWAWIGSAYKVNCIGLYGINYPDMEHPFSHFPINSNANYIWEDSVNNIKIEQIINLYEKMYLR